MNTSKSSKGFTIIELLVVVTIIAILAAIVLVNVTQYIARGKDAAIKGNLSSVLIDAAVAIDGGATNVCTDISVLAALAGADSANDGGSVDCDDATDPSTAWAACSQMKVDNTKYFCVDSRGIKKEVTGTCTEAGFAVTACP